MRSPYEILGVKKTAKVSEIKKAFRVLAKEYHPDTHPDDPEAAEKMIQLHRAYEVLIDPDMRRIYDETGYVPEDHAMSIDEEALALISNLLSSLVEKFKNWILYVDLIKELKDAITHMQEACEGDKKESIFQQTVLIDASKRVKVHEEKTKTAEEIADENLIKELLERMAEKPEEVLHKADRFMAISKKALDIIDHYEYSPKAMTEKQKEEFNDFLHPKNPFADLFGALGGRGMGSE
jgi:curved DNA-binding protein CbpA